MMEHHFERTMTLNTKSKYENLYQWSITEAESDGKNTIDVIPWEWRLNYTATECYLSDALTLSLGFAFKKEDREASLDERQTIRIKLRPGHTQADGDTSHATRHSMFGTSRTVEDIWLRIYCHADEDSKDVCEAWGCVSYTMEIDFRNETQDDTLHYTLVVKPSTFARYVDYISSGKLDFIYFSASHVVGFYSEWSPGISTHRIKILTADKEHKVEGDGEGEIELPRLREVGDWSLDIVRKPPLRTQLVVPPLDGRMDAPAELVVPAPGMSVMPAVTDPETKKALQSMKQAAWWAVALLAVLAVKAVLH